MRALDWMALLTSASCAAFGQILLKLGAQGGRGAFGLLDKRLFFGLALYAIGMALWIFALRRLPLSAVYPFTTLTLVLVGVMSFLVLGERPSGLAMCGWAIIVGGVGLVWLGSRL